MISFNICSMIIWWLFDISLISYCIGLLIFFFVRLISITFRFHSINFNVYSMILFDKFDIILYMVINYFYLIFFSIIIWCFFDASKCSIMFQGYWEIWQILCIFFSFFLNFFHIFHCKWQSWSYLSNNTILGGSLAKVLMPCKR